MKQCLYILLFSAFAIVSCTKYNNPQPVFEDYEKDLDTTIITRKILVVAIDGLVGKELEKSVPTNMQSMLQHAKYSYRALADENTSEPSSFATMFTGVSASRHHITTDSYIPEPDPLHPHNNTGFSPTVFYMLNENNNTLGTVAIVQDRQLGNTFLMDANKVFIENSDDLVKDKALAELKNTNTDFLLVHLKSVVKAGSNSSFSIESEEYKSAIDKVDQIIGALKSSIEARSTYKKEDWLIIVTSTHGGKDSSYGGSSPEERNIFTLYYNKDIKGQELNAETLAAARFYGYDVTNANPTNAMRARNTTASTLEEKYNIATKKAITIEAKMKVNKNGSGNYSYSWPPFLSKVNARTGNTAGWSFFRSGNQINFFVGDGASKIEVGSGVEVGVNEIWSHITGVFEVVNNVPTVKVYVNGNLTGTGTAALDVSKITSTSPLTFGFQPEVFSTAYFDFYLSDVHIWDTALSENEIKENASRFGVRDNHPKIANLTGNWPLDAGSTSFLNLVEGMPNLPISGSANYRLFGNNIPSMNAANSVLFKSQDITSQIMYWFGFKPNEDLGLEGADFLKNFEIEFIK